RNKMVLGNVPIDGGNLILSRSEKEGLIKSEPKAARWIRKFIGAEEFVNSKDRYCLWLIDATQNEIKELHWISSRVAKVYDFRLKSKRLGTRKLSSSPHLFGEIRQPKSGSYILVPYTTSERRDYVPIGFMDSSV